MVNIGIRLGVETGLGFTGASPEVRVARGASFLAAASVWSNGLYLLFYAFAARFLPTVADLGRVSAMFLLSNFFLTFSALGIPPAITRFMAQYFGKGEDASARGLFRKGLQVGILVAGLSSFVAFFLSQAISLYLLQDAGLSFLVRYLAFDVFLVVLSPFLSSALLARQKFRDISSVTSIAVTVKYSTGILLVVRGLGLYGVVLGWVTGDAVSVSLLAFLGYRLFKGAFSIVGLRSLLGYSLPLYASTVTTYLSNNVDRFLILGLAGASTLGLYSPAIGAASILALVPNSMSSALFPQLSQMQARGGGNSVLSAGMKASRYIFLTYVPLTFGLAVTAFPLIRLFFGSRFIGSAPALSVLTVTFGLTGAGIVIGSMLLAVGYTKVLLYSSLAGILADIGLSFVLIPPLGALGGAFARSGLTVAGFGYSAYGLKSKLGLRLDVTSFKKSVLGSALMAVVVGLVESILLSELLVPLYIALGALVYLLSLRIQNALTLDDVGLIKGFVPRRFEKLTERVGMLLVHSE